MIGRATITLIAVVILTWSATAHSGVASIQYVPSSSGYEDAWGFGFYQIRYKSFGIYGNLATTIRENEPHYDSLNTQSFGDPVTDRFKELTLFSVGATRNLSSHFSVYAGFGYGWGEAKAEKHDPTNILADDGEYYVDDPSNDDSGGNVNVGVLLAPGDSLTIDVGYHSFPGTGYVGLGWKF